MNIIKINKRRGWWGILCLLLVSGCECKKQVFDKQVFTDCVKNSQAKDSWAIGACRNAATMEEECKK